MTEEKKEKKKEVAFNFDVGKTRMRKVEVDGYEPFQITFRIPNGAAGMDISLGMVDVEKEEGEEGDEILASRGEAMIKFMAQHLDAWSLPDKPNHKTLSAIQDASVLMAISTAIINEGKIQEEKTVKN